MKRCFAFAFILALVSIPAFAASKSTTVRFSSDVTVGSAKLPAGEYKLTYDGTAPNVQVTLVQKGVTHPVTATVPAKLTEQKNDRVATTTNGTALEDIELKNATLEFSGAPANGQ